MNLGISLSTTYSIFFDAYHNLDKSHVATYLIYYNNEMGPSLILKLQGQLMKIWDISRGVSSWGIKFKRQILAWYDQ